MFIASALIVSLCAGVVHGGGAGASAQDKASAKDKYRHGVKAFSEGRYKDAVDLFLQADRIVQNESFAFNASHAYDKMGDHGNALRWAREYLRRAPDAADRAKVEQSVRRFEAQLQHNGVQQLTFLSSPPGAMLIIDGRALGVTPWTGELSPGEHRASLRLRGFDDAIKAFALPADSAIDVSVTLQAAAPEPAPTARDATADETSAPLLPLGLSALGVGVASLGVALGLEVARAGAEQDARDERFQVDARPHVERAADLEMPARVMLGVGAAFAAVGSALLTIELASGDEPSPPVFEAACSGLDCTLQLRF